MGDVFVLRSKLEVSKRIGCVCRLLILKYYLLNPYESQACAYRKWVIWLRSYQVHLI